MKGKGNGDPQNCVENLLRTSRYSVPYERIKGIDGDLIDGRADTSVAEMAADAEWLLETYEPRVKVNTIEVNNQEGVGDFGITADISTNSDEEEG